MGRTCSSDVWQQTAKTNILWWALQEKTFSWRPEKAVQGQSESLYQSLWHLRNTWETFAKNLTAWRAKITSDVDDEEARRLDEAVKKRAAWKARAGSISTCGSEHTCPTCDRDCRAKIGLISYLRTYRPSSTTDWTNCCGHLRQRRTNIIITPFTHFRMRSGIISDEWSVTIWESSYRPSLYIKAGLTSGCIRLCRKEIKHVNFFVQEHSGRTRSVLTPGASVKTAKMSGCAVQKLGQPGIRTLSGKAWRMPVPARSVLGDYGQSGTLIRDHAGLPKFCWECVKGLWLMRAQQW